MNRLEEVLKNSRRLTNVKLKNGDVKRVKEYDAYMLVEAGASYCSRTEYQKFNGTFRTAEEKAKELEESKNTKKSKKKDEK